MNERVPMEEKMKWRVELFPITPTFDAKGKSHLREIIPGSPLLCNHRICLVGKFRKSGKSAIKFLLDANFLFENNTPEFKWIVRVVDDYELYLPDQIESIPAATAPVDLEADAVDSGHLGIGYANAPLPIAPPVPQAIAELNLPGNPNENLTGGILWIVDLDANAMPNDWTEVQLPPVGGRLFYLANSVP